MNIFLFELRRLWKSMLIWAAALIAVCALMMSIFPAYAESADIIRQMVKGFPPAVLAAFGMNMDTLFGVSGFYSFLMTYIALIGAIQATGLGIGIFSREYREKTADFLLSKPVRRDTVVTAKLFAALTALVFTNVVYLAASTPICRAIGGSDTDLRALVMISLTLFFIQLAFFCIGAAVAVFLRIKSVTSTALMVTLLFFALSMIESMVDKKVMQFLTPFRFFDTTAIAQTHAYEASSIVAVGIVCAVCVAAVYQRSIRRDVHAA